MPRNPHATPRREHRLTSTASPGVAATGYTRVVPPHDAALVQASLTPHSESGDSIHDVERIDSTNIHRFTPHTGRRVAAARHLRRLGFEVHDHAGSTLIIRGPHALFEATFGHRLIDRHAARRGTGPRIARFELERSETPGLVSISARRHPELASVARGLALSEPVGLFDAARPPRVSYPHLQLPEGLVVAMNARATHKTGLTGSGIHVAICDTGFYRHPWFSRFRSRVRVVLSPGASDPKADEIGHGTMVAANLLSIAPDCRVTVVKMNFMGNDGFSNDAVSALTIAEASRADVINCSWGCSIADAKAAKSAHIRTVEFLLARLVASGRIVVGAAGNFPRDGGGRGEFGFPAQHPDVIAVGGANSIHGGRLRAANYASSFKSEVYIRRDVPDVCGICGDLPCGVLIMSPVQPGCVMDREAASDPYPRGDETAADDGWCCVSGTSAASPQVAGVVALLLQANRTLRHTVLMRALLQLSARDVTSGTTNPRTVRSGLSNRARRGPDLATGAGLVDVGAAILLVRQLQRHRGRA